MAPSTGTARYLPRSRSESQLTTKQAAPLLPAGSSRLLRKKSATLLPLWEGVSLSAHPAWPATTRAATPWCRPVLSHRVPRRHLLLGPCSLLFFIALKRMGQKLSSVRPHPNCRELPPDGRLDAPRNTQHSGVRHHVAASLKLRVKDSSAKAVAPPPVRCPSSLRPCRPPSMQPSCNLADHAATAHRFAQMD